MHATLDMAGGGTATASFHTTFPDERETVVVERSVYGGHAAPRWRTIALVVLGHVALIGALIKLDVIPMAKAKHGPLVIDLVIEPPVPPPVPTETAKPVEKVRSLIVAPQPIVQVVAPAPSPVVTTPTPPPPKAEVAPITPPAPAGPVSVDDVSSNMLHYESPKYPIELRRQRKEGIVRLLLVIDTQGRVAQASIIDTSGFKSMDQSALDAVRRWLFKPFMRGGVPVEVQGAVRFPFKLK
ncbi:energy transducer TonB [Sphingomonas montanisoli]|uniref:Energy transducer TonB n=1 Tax=Sphingomonas montanisoli TaxID=2606412 RepID=A0A5D9CBJ2_9SPHN|nr:energy transducer TonB [Sphingomonas montanisoli]TZG27435.1 energy transducer TonB [Sphingomonas montanisoli]